MKRVLGAVVAASLVLVLQVSPAAAGPPTTGFDAGSGLDDAYVDNGNNSWELDADAGTAKHINNKSGRENSISIADFLEVWYDATAKETGTAHQSALVDCPGGGTWRSYFTRGMTMRSLAWSDGVAVSFEAAGAFEDRVAQTGAAAYVLQGTYHATSGALVNARVRGFEGGSTTSDTATLSPAYAIDWTHVLGSGGVSWGLDGRLWTQATDASGNGLGRCGGVWDTRTVTETQTMIWYTSGWSRDDVTS